MPWNAAYWGNLLGLVAYALGVLALVGGALLSGRLGTRWAGRRWLFETHQWISWAVLVLGVVHGLLLWPRRGGATSLVPGGGRWECPTCHWGSPSRPLPCTC